MFSLLFKKGDSEDLRNWRHVTLMCVDYKLIAKVLTGRLKKAMFRILERFGFGVNFFKWLRIMYRGVGSRVNVNGHIGDLVRQKSG